MTSSSAGSFPEFSVGDAFRIGWEALKKNYGPIIIAVIVLILINVPISLLQNFIAGDDIVLSTAIGMVPNIFLITPISLGVMFMGVLACRGQSVSPGTMFVAFSHYGTIVGITIVGTMIFLACAIPAGVGAAAGSMVGDESGLLVGLVAGGLVSFVIYAFVMVRLMFAGTCCLDPENEANSVTTCLSASWDKTGAVLFPLIGLGLLLVGIITVSALMLCCPVIFFGYPLGVTTMGAAYVMIFGGPARA